MKIKETLRSRRFWAFADKISKDHEPLQRLIEHGWIASISVVGETPVLTLELPNSSDVFPLPGEDPAAVAAFVAEWNRRVEDLHTPR